MEWRLKSEGSKAISVYYPHKMEENRKTWTEAYILAGVGIPISSRAFLSISLTK